MDKILLGRLRDALLLTKELSESVDEHQLHRCINGVASNSIGSQFWCIVGARESYARGIVAGTWQGFACSLSREQTRQASSVRSALDVTQHKVLDAIERTEMSEGRWQLVLDLWEHEIQHQGQLIRYFYANGILFPEPFASRYALSQPKIMEA
ncbi:hypothetical protein [Rhizobium leguminosarum]